MKILRLGLESKPDRSFWFTFIVTRYVHNFFCDFRKIYPKPKWTIYKHISDKSKKCLSIDNSGNLVVVCLCNRSCLHQLMKRPGIFTKS